MKIAQISDIHFGTQDDDALQRVAANLSVEEPDVIAVCGDLTQRGKHSEFDAAALWLEQFKGPKLVVAGNHDTPLLNAKERIAQPFARFEKRFGPSSNHVTVGDLDLFGLNTARGWQARRNWAEGVVDLDDLDAHLSQATQTSVLVCHHPFQSPPNSPLETSTRRGLEAGRRVAASPLNLLLSGHVHAPTSAVWKHETGSYLALTAGTLSTRLRDKPPSYNMVTINPDQIMATAHSIQDGETNKYSLGAWAQNNMEPLPS